MTDRALDPRPGNAHDHALAAATLDPGAWDRVGGRPAAWTFLALLAAWTMVVFTVWTTWPGQDHGTRMADSNILNAGRVYAAHGFTHRHGIPQLETYEDGERRPVLYGTYPPGPYWIHAGLRLGGMESLPAIRGVSVAGSAVAGVLALAAFSVLARSCLVGAVAGGFYCFSSAFSGYADSVHMNVWMQSGLFWFLLCWAGFERGRGVWRWVWLAAAGVAYLFEIWMTLEHIGLIALVVGVRTILSGRRSVWIGGGVLAGVCVSGMASRVWHLTFEFGTVDAAMDYLLGKYEHRSGEGSPGKGGVGLAEVVTPWLRLLRWDDAPSDSRFREFAYPFLQPAVLSLCGGLVVTLVLARIPGFHTALGRARARARERAASLGRHGASSRLRARDWLDVMADSRVGAVRGARGGLGWGVLLLVASLHWHVFMRQHASIHPHVILNMLPGMALILGSLASGGLRLAMPDARGTGWIRWAGVPLATALACVFLVHLRDGAVLNRLFTLTPMRAELLARSRADQWWRDLGEALGRQYGSIRRVVFYHWGPRQANLIALPHQYVEGGQMPAWFGDPTKGAMPAGADLLLVEFPRRQKTPRVILEEGYDRFGMPEIDQGPESTTLVFGPVRPPGAPGTVECDVRFAGGLRIERLRLAPTIRGDAWALCLLIHGPNAGAFAPGPSVSGGGDPGASAPVSDGSPPQAVLPTGMPRATLAALVRTFDAAGHRTGVFNPRLALRATYRNRSLVWVLVDRERLEDAGTIRVALTRQGREDVVELERGRILPEGVRVDSQSNELVWEVRLPAPRMGAGGPGASEGHP